MRTAALTGARSLALPPGRHSAALRLSKSFSLRPTRSTCGSSSSKCRGTIIGGAMSHPERVEPGPGQESVWDYPRPPACQPSDSHVQVFLDGEILADSKRTHRVLETSHPPVFYIPREDIRMERLQKEPNQKTYCEWKGSASYFSAGSRRAIAWTYEDPVSRFAAIKGALAFYPSKVDRVVVDGETARAQEGDFYGGVITSKIVGPFKGGRGTLGW